MSNPKTALIDGVNSQLPVGVEIIRRSYQTSTATYNLNATLANSTISFDVEAGGIYAIRGQLFITSGAGGLKYDFDGGTATVTTFYFVSNAFDSTTAGTARQVQVTSAIATDVTTVALAGGTGEIDCSGYVNFATSGTFKLRAAQNSSNAADSALLIGSNITLVKLN